MLVSIAVLIRAPRRESLDHHVVLSELEQLEAQLESLPDHAESRLLGRAPLSDHAWLPIYGLRLGTDDGTAPTFIIVGGIHGLERIGTRVALSFMSTLIELMQWDKMTQVALRHARVLFIPLVNPVGMLHTRRGNWRKVDLMRNAPAEPDAKGALLLGGQRVSRHLPWYMGPSTTRLEIESSALMDYIHEHTLHSRAVICIDLHSGFGMVDRIWFPYARQHRPFGNLAELWALKSLVDRTLPNHIYKFEPQSSSYTIRTDLWDYAYDSFRAHNPQGVMLPLTLEMGSWLWIRKNPRQLLRTLGAFNPMLPHREKRTLRRHLPLLDFLFRAVQAPQSWAWLTGTHRRDAYRQAVATWYAD